MWYSSLFSPALGHLTSPVLLVAVSFMAISSFSLNVLFSLQVKLIHFFPMNYFWSPSLGDKILLEERVFKGSGTWILLFPDFFLNLFSPFSKMYLSFSFLPAYWIEKWWNNDEMKPSQQKEPCSISNFLSLICGFQNFPKLETFDTVNMIMCS